MPGKVAVKIKAGRNLPVMDRSSDTTDAYVEIKLGTVTQKTDVCHKTLNPQWNTDWFRFEVDDAELQDEPLQIRLMDHDTYSANDAIGKVNISLNPLCLDTSGQSTHGKGTVLSGWIPVFDTMHGIRGEVNVIVKVDLFSDLNKFRQSSCGIPFFHSQCIPHGYRAQVIHGFVEELVVNDDPEYQWIDKIRTPRASNEARQVVFLKLSGQVQRKMGLKAINMGANAVIGYTQCFDLEGDVGVVARGIGTAVTLIKDTSSQPAIADNALIEERTLKYLEFLTGAGVGLSEQPEYRLQIIKSDSSTLFDLRRASAEADDSEVEIMQDLLRQEDERDEKPVKKLKHHMRRFTHSSRNIFNEKYIAFKRKMNDVGDPKYCDHTSRSMSSLLMSSFIKEESSSSVRSSMQDVRRQSFKAKHKRVTPTQPFQRQLLMKTTHPIVRSISDDTAMKHTNSSVSAHKSSMSNSTTTGEYQDSTRSSPTINSASGQHELRLMVNDGAVVHPFGQFSKHSPHLAREKEHSSFILKSSTSSLTLDSSSSSREEDESKLNISATESDSNLKIEASTSANCSASIDEQRERVNRILKICSLDEEHKDADNWIQPGQLESVEDSLPVMVRRHSLLHDLKACSQHIQELVHKPKKAGTQYSDSQVPTMLTRTPRRSPPKILPVNCFPTEIRKSYYSSQPEILNECDAYMPVPPPASRKLTRSCSLTDVIKLSTTSADYLCCANIAQSFPTAPEANFPILTICPSTPTPSESEHSQLSPSDLKSIVDSHNPNPSMFTSVENEEERLRPTGSNPKCHALGVEEDSAYIGNHPQSSPAVTTDNNTLYLKLRSYYLNVNAYTNQNINMNSSLLAPFISTVPPHIKNCLHHIHQSHNQRHQHHHRHQPRSLNEINGSSGASGGLSAITDSPSMKRFASPASAAVVAAAAASGPISGSRSKLSPSPSKMGMTTGATSSQADSVSSATSTATTMIPKDVSELCRRSSDSDLSVTPKGNSICVASERLVAATAMMRLSQPLAGKSANATDSLDMLEYPFLTMTKYPSGFILHLGATVAARSVKLLERVPNPDEPEIRDSWWTELRMEIRSHARALGCNVVLGYSESTTISDEVCVLSATGTAAVINMAYNRSVSQTDIMTTAKSSLSGGVSGISASLEERDMLKDARSEQVTINKETGSSSFGTAQCSNNSSGKKSGLPPLNVGKNFSCTVCHIPYSLTSVPFNVKMKKCAICRKGRVPDVLLATLEVPEYLQVTGRGCFMQAQVVRAKKDLRSELNAKEISDGLPFLEYELHRLLINKLKAKGMNAIFGLKAQVAIGERMIALIATGTALFLSALPIPQVPKIVAGNSWTDKQKLNELQKKLQETFERNQEIYQLKCIDPDSAGATTSGAQLDKQSDTDESDDEVIEIDLNCGNKDTCVLEVDDIEDLEIISLLMEPYPPEGFHVVNTQMVPGMLDLEAVKNLQMFTQVWRAKLDVGQNISGFPKHFQRLLQTIYFKLRTMIPCAICDLRFRLDLPESDQIQLLVTGMALGLGDSSKFKYRRKTVHTNGFSFNDNATTNVSLMTDVNGAMHGQKRMLQEEDYIFPLDEDQMVETPTPTSNLPPYGTYSLKLRKTSPSRTTSKANAAARNRYFPLRDRYGIDITPLSLIPGGKIEKYLGNLNFFFIRESTSIRENGGISGFVHGFITELLAVVRAHIAALGGNAMVSFYMTELILVDNQHKNQGQCLISIGGDAVYVSYYADD